MSKILGLIVVAFAVYTVVTAPAVAAGWVHSAAHAATVGLSGMASFADALLT